MAQTKIKKAAATTSTTKKIVDIKADGDGAIGNSRSIIVNNRPILKDPMMAEVSKLTGGGSSGDPVVQGKTDNQAESDASETVTVRRETKIQPLSTAENEAAAPSSTDESASKDADDVPKQDDSAEPIAVKLTNTAATSDVTGAPELSAKDSKTKPQPASTDAKIVEEAAAPAASDEKPASDGEAQPAETAATTDEANPTAEAESIASETEAEAETSAVGVQAGRSFDDTASNAPAQPDADAAKTDGKKESEKPDYGQLNAEQQKAVDSGEYFLPIKTAEGRRVRREIIAAVFFVVLLVVAWVDIMLDAGLIKIDGIHALTHFFQ
jgi:hypothetical protein